ncbi:MAG: hypothetical protein ACE5G2_03520 [Candidatus Krumholzibacteriia bacterium]
MTPRPDRRRLEGDDTRLDLVRYLRVVWRRKLFVVLPVVFITSITVVGVRFMSPLYVSSSKIHLERRTRVNRELERQIVDEDRRVRRKDVLAKVKGQLTSREFLETVTRDLGLHNDPAILARSQLLHETRTPDVPTEEIAMRILVRGLRSKLKVKSSAPNTFQISVHDNDPENAYLLAKVVTRSFVDEVKRQRMEKLAELFKFSSQQSRIYRERLEEAEKELRDFQAQLIREQSAGSPVNVANINQARNYHRRMQLDFEQAERRIDNLRGVLARVFDPLPDVRGLRRQRDVLALGRRLRVSSEEDLLTDLERMRSASGGVVLGGELATDGMIRSSLRRRLAELVDLEYAATDAFYRDKIAEYAYEGVLLDIEQAKASSLQEKIRAYRAKAEEQPEKELQLRALEERVTSARMSLETFERTLQSAELSETIMATQLGGGVSIVDPAEKPVSPVRPNKRRLVALAFLLALAGGLGSIFAVEYLDKSFKDIEEIERVLGLHVVGTVPRVTEGLPFGSIPSNRKRKWLLASSFVILFVVLGGMALYERLLRKQKVAVPQARIEAILQRDTASSTAPAGPGDSAPAVEPRSLPWWTGDDASSPAGASGGSTPAAPGGSAGPSDSRTPSAGN